MLKSAAHVLVSHPWVYDKVQRLVGSERVFAHLAPHAKKTLGDRFWTSEGVPEMSYRLFLPPVTIFGSTAIRSNFRVSVASIRCSPASSAMPQVFPFKDKSVDDVLCTHCLASSY